MLSYTYASGDGHAALCLDRDMRTPMRCSQRMLALPCCWAKFFLIITALRFGQLDRAMRVLALSTGGMLLSLALHLGRLAVRSDVLAPTRWPSMRSETVGAPPPAMLPHASATIMGVLLCVAWRLDDCLLYSAFFCLAHRPMWL
jgi:hypothetical protein